MFQSRVKIGRVGESFGMRDGRAGQLLGISEMKIEEMGIVVSLPFFHFVWAYLKHLSLLDKFR